jgi:hypothetical protein
VPESSPRRPSIFCRRRWRPEATRSTSKWSFNWRRASHPSIFSRRAAGGLRNGALAPAIHILPPRCWRPEAARSTSKWSFTSLPRQAIHILLPSRRWRPPEVRPNRAFIGAAPAIHILPPLETGGRQKYVQMEQQVAPASSKVVPGTKCSAGSLNESISRIVMCLISFQN